MGSLHIKAGLPLHTPPPTDIHVQLAGLGRIKSVPLAAWPSDVEKKKRYPNGTVMSGAAGWS